MESGSWWARYCLATRYEIVGDFERATEALPPVEMAAGVWWAVATVLAARARVLRSAGRNEDAKEEFQRWVETISGAGMLEADSNVWNMVLVLPFLIGGLSELADDSLCTAVYTALTSGALGRAGRTNPPIAQARGELALRLNLLPEAEQHFQFGVSQAEAQRLPLQHGVCLQGLAEVAERRGEGEQAMAYLDRAGELFSRHGAKLYLD